MKSPNVDDDGEYEDDFDNAITTKGLTVLSRALEMNTTLRVLEFGAPVGPISRLRGDVYGDSVEADAARDINRRANEVLYRSIKKELDANTAPEKRMRVGVLY